MPRRAISWMKLSVLGCISLEKQTRTIPAHLGRYSKRNFSVALQQDLAHDARPEWQERSDVATRLDDHRVTVPVVEERAVVRKRKRVTGAVRVRTLVHRREEVVDAPLAVERVEVERVPLDRWLDAPVPVRREGDTTVVTFHEEVVVVEKRLRATEEVRITRRTSTGTVKLMGPVEAR